MNCHRIGIIITNIFILTLVSSSSVGHEDDKEAADRNFIDITKNVVNTIISIRPNVAENPDDESLESPATTENISLEPKLTGHPEESMINPQTNGSVSSEPSVTKNFDQRAKSTGESTENLATEGNIMFGPKPIESFDESVEKTYAEEASKNAESKSNVTISEMGLNNATLKIYSNCLKDETYGTVEVVNASRLMELLKLAAPTNRSESKNAEEKSPPRTCLLVLFYARWCVFSSQAAPHFNALPRFFPHIKAVAIDASKYQNFNTQFGIVGVPTLMFIYNGKPLVKFNDTMYTLEMFARFVTTYTALEPNASLYVTSADFGGPIQSTPSNETDYCLVVSWIFIAACAIYFTFQSHWWRQFVELVQNTWRESNAQHEHVD